MERGDPPICHRERNRVERGDLGDCFVALLLAMTGEGAPRNDREGSSFTKTGSLKQLIVLLHEPDVVVVFGDNLFQHP